jgi:hypothetical protein
LLTRCRGGRGGGGGEGGGGGGGGGGGVGGDKTEEEVCINDPPALSGGNGQCACVEPVSWLSMKVTARDGHNPITPGARPFA